MLRAFTAVVLGCAVGVFAVAPLACADAKSGSVTVCAQVRSTILLDITTPGDGQSVGFGDVDPGVVTPEQTVDVVVRSNRPYSMIKTALDAETLGLSTSLPSSSANAVTNATVFTDRYSLNVPETTDPGSHSATVQYTVVQE